MIVRDEQQRLPGALASVAFADELVVVDSGSTDRTRDIARTAGAKVIENAWPGFAAQRNVALDNATSDWVIEIDADERISPKLAHEIRAFLAHVPDDVDIAGLPLRDQFLGRPIGPSAKYPKYRLRMFRRGSYRHDERRGVHEGLEATGRVWWFGGDLEHLLAGTWREALSDAYRYARLEADGLAPLDGPASSASAIALRPTAKFGYRVVVDGGWRDGWRGLVKIGLDCGTDAYVGLLRRRTDAPPVHGHYGKRGVYTGAIRLVGLAHGAQERVQLLNWLQRAAAAGADVALIADEPGAARPWIQTRPVTRFGPLLLARALEAERQLRPVDALVLGPGVPRHAIKALPDRLRGPNPSLALTDDPELAVDRLSRTRLPVVGDVQ